MATTAMASPGTSLPSLDFSRPAPAWATKLAEQAIRDRDTVPVEVWPDTPRSEEGEKDELVGWLWMAVRVVQLGRVGYISKRDWIRWGELFDSMPGVEQYFRHLLAEEPREIRACPCASWRSRNGITRHRRTSTRRRQAVIPYTLLHPAREKLI